MFCANHKSNNPGWARRVYGNCIKPWRRKLDGCELEEKWDASAGSEIGFVKSAEILPLDGKYYGTRVVVNFKDDDSSEIKLWYNGTFHPSTREIESYGYTKEQYDEGEIVEDGWGGQSSVKDIIEICDSHFESEETLTLAQFIVGAINAICNLKEVKQ